MKYSAQIAVFVLCILSLGHCCKFLPGTTFPKPYTCTTPTGQLAWQADGNLVIYNTKNTAKWASNTGNRGHRAIFQTDGNFVIYDASNAPIWYTYTFGKGVTYLEFGSDRNLVVGTPSATLWQSDTKNTEYSKATLYTHWFFEGDKIDIFLLDQCHNLPANWRRQASSIYTHDTCVHLYEGFNCQGNWIEVKPGTPSHDNLADSRVNFNDKTQSVSPCGTFQSSQPLTWKEHWFEHNQNIQRMYADADLVVYYDADVNRGITWPFQFLGDVWRYTRNIYGDFGPENNLYAIFHAARYAGGHPATYMDAHHDFRNVIDCGLEEPNAWVAGKGQHLEMPIHEIAHIVESASHGILFSPAFGLWRDSKWAEIFIYDVFRGLGRTAEATDFYNKMMSNTNGDSFPRPGTLWFKNWFYPIYSKYGGNRVLAKYFLLQAQHFPKQGFRYSKSMNMGEFVHFWSGAANSNLLSQATTAFGWTTEWQNQLNTAKQEFPGIIY